MGAKLGPVCQASPGHLAGRERDRRKVRTGRDQREEAKQDTPPEDRIIGDDRRHTNLNLQIDETPDRHEADEVHGE